MEADRVSAARRGTVEESVNTHSDLVHASRYEPNTSQGRFFITTTTQLWTGAWLLGDAGVVLGAEAGEPTHHWAALAKREALSRL
jgi:hypothetical protein